MHKCQHSLFSAWGGFVGKYPFFVLVSHVILFTWIAKGALTPKKLKEERLAYTPVDSQSVKEWRLQKDLKKVYEKIGSGKKDKVKSGGIQLLATAKWPNTTSIPNIMSVASFKEMVDFEVGVINQTYLEMDWRDETKEGGSSDDDDTPSETDGGPERVKAKRALKKKQNDAIRAKFNKKKIYWKDICEIAKDDESGSESDDYQGKPIPSR